MHIAAIQQKIFQIIDKNALLLIMVSGLFVRVFFYFLSPNILYIDEIYQYIEPAYSYYKSNTIFTWEYQVDIRNWLWPSFIAIFVWPAQILIGTLFSFKFSVVLLCSLLSLMTIYAAYKIGCIENRNTGILAAFFTAFWCDFIYFSSHPLTEIVANNFLMLGIAFAFCARVDPLVKDRPVFQNLIFFCGLMLGFAFIFRFHLAPVLMCIAIYVIIYYKLRGFYLIFLGSIFPLFLYGLFDYIKIGFPFQSIYNNIKINIIYGASKEFGVEPFYYYLLSDYFFGLSFVFCLFYVFKLKINNKLNFIFLLSTVNLIFFSFIEHKEIRFIYSSYMLNFIFIFINIIKNYNVRYFHFLYICMFILFFSFTANDRLKYLWKHHQVYIYAAEELNKKNDMCGLGLYGTSWISFPGSSFLQKDVLIYQDNITNEEEGSKLDENYNYVVVGENFIVKDQFKIQNCYKNQLTSEKICIYKREGACSVSHNDSLNQHVLHNNVPEAIRHKIIK